MNALDWHRFLVRQQEEQGKVLFTVAELANVTGLSRNSVGVQLSRLRRRNVVRQYARGRYGLPEGVDLVSLVRAIDKWAYVTGAAALHGHGFVTQAQTRITCFTNRRSNRSRVRVTPLGRIVLVCVKPPIYTPPAESGYAAPEQALLDFVWICRREGVSPQSIVTLRGLDRIDLETLVAIGSRYPRTVREATRDLVDGQQGAVHPVAEPVGKA
jgi:hypothetical protein